MVIENKVEFENKSKSKIATKLKIAVCFFGHVRSYKKCAPFLYRNFLKYYDCDLFMHTWTKLDHNTQTWHNFKTAKGDTCEADIIRTYSKFASSELKKIKIEEQIPQDFGNIKIKTANNAKEKQISIFGMGAMFHSMREAGNLCKEYAAENKTQYDYVLFIRPDLWIKNPFRIDKMLLALSEQQIAKSFFTLAHNHSALIAGFENMGANDVLFFAKPETIFSVIENTTQAIKDYEPDVIISHSPEYALIKLVKERGFTPYRIDFNIPKNWEIYRASETMKLRKRLISLRVRTNLFKLHLLPKMMRHIINLQINLLGIFTIGFAIGNPE